MSSRKEEERNEKIIRGLMKLPPNRRCINCNILGPQYVCTDFWTFICMTCSGIHREFTHRVKSVSMAKFTSQEVQALQNGGNQRARDIYLKDWDFQTQRLPISSNVEKVREFIKIVYVDRRYARGKASDKPPRDTQSPTICAAETRRASSYHSYSQSPPYDDQYEDRRYGKQAAALSRKFGSDGGRHEGKMSSFICSPGRFSDQSFEERFAIVESGQRVPNYSACSEGEDVGTQASISSLETNGKNVGDGIPHPQRITSSGSFGSLESNSFSMKSYGSGGLVDFFSEPEQGACSPGENDSNLLQQRGPARCDSLDPSKAPSAPQRVSSGSTINLFQLPASSQVPSVDGLQPPSLTASGTQAASLDLFANMSQQHSTATANKIIDHAVPENEGWATFDTPQSTASTAHIDTDPMLHNDVSLSEKFDPLPAINSNTQISSFDTPNLTSAFSENNSRLPTSDMSSIENFDPLSSLNENFQLPSFENYGTSGPGQMKSNPWDDILPNVPAPIAEPWNAFENANERPSTEVNNQSLQMDNFVSSEDPHLHSKYFEECDMYKIQNVNYDIGFPDKGMISQNISSPSLLPPMGEICKSHNPFDLPFDSDSEQSNMFLDMSSLKGALPNCPLQSTFNVDVAQPWFSQNPVPVPPYISSAGPGGLTCMTAHPTSSPIPNVQSQGPVASIGGNPFA